MRLAVEALKEFEAVSPALVAEVRRLQDLLLGVADASGKVLGQDLAAIAQERGVEMAEKVAIVLGEVEAIREERRE